MIRVIRQGLCLGLLLLSACAITGSSTPSRVEIAHGVALELPDQPPFGPRATAVQLVQARYGDRTATLQAFIESDATRTIVVMTLPSGPRILSVEWRYKSFVTQLAPMTPDGMTGEHMLADMMVIYAPMPLLKAALSGGQVIADSDGNRRIVKDGETLIQITRSSGGPGTNPWNGRAELENFSYHYSLSIDSQSSVP